MSKFKPEYKPLANPRQMDQFCQETGVLPDLAEIGKAHNYNYGLRELDWLTHFRGHVLMMTTETIRAPVIMPWSRKTIPCFKPTELR